MTNRSDAADMRAKAPPGLWIGLPIVMLLMAGCAEGTAPPKPGATPTSKASPSKAIPAKLDAKNVARSKQVAQKAASPRAQAKPAKSAAVRSAKTTNAKALAERARLVERESSERLLLLTAGGPLIVEVPIFIDGRPYQLARTERVDALLKLLPKQANEQTWLTAFASPEFALAVLDQEVVDARRQLQLLKEYDSDADGILDRSELPGMLAKQDREAFTLDIAGGAGYRQVDTPLWRVLDADASGHLTDEELRSVEERLKTRDADDNDVLDAAELNLPVAAQPGAAPAMADEPTGPRLVHLLGPSANWPAIRYAIQELYQYDGAIQASHFPLAPGLVAQLDADFDGEFDLEESSGLNTVPPHLELEAHFPAAASKAGLKLRAVSAELEASDPQVTETATSVVLALPIARLQFTWNDALAGAQQMAMDQFTILDGDKNGYLEKSEGGIPGNPLANDFEKADTNDDSKIYPDEFSEYLMQTQAAQRRRVHARMDGQGDATFSVLDSNGDGRLSLRDIRRAAERFSDLDQNADGEIALAELPLVLSLTLERGAAPAGNPTAPGAQMTAPVAAPRDAPRWFVAMDTNGDGDISRREFLGPSPLFDRLDLNQDGFVDVPEAGRSAPDDSPAPTTAPQADLPP